MSLITSLPDIDNLENSVFVMHERFEKFIPNHSHRKGQLSYVEGGLAYLQINDRHYVIPARHYFWVPQGLVHILKIGHSGTVLRSLFFIPMMMTSILFILKSGFTQLMTFCRK